MNLLIVAIDVFIYYLVSSLVFQILSENANKQVDQLSMKIFCRQTFISLFRDAPINSLFTFVVEHGEIQLTAHLLQFVRMPYLTKYPSI